MSLRQTRHVFQGCLVLLCCQAQIAMAEFEASLYLGKSSSQDSDVSLSLPNNTHLTFHNVGWDDRSFENPVYYGARIVYWLPRARSWGLGVDFTHAKIYADLNASVRVSGVRTGTPVDTREPLRNSFSDLAMSHGLNQLTVNVLYRWRHRERGGLAPYVGAGVGLAYPHVEVTTGGNTTDEYQLAGWVVGGLAGIKYEFGNDIAAFGEFKLSYTDVHANLMGGGDLDTSVWTQHFNMGISYRFGAGYGAE